MPVGRFSFSGVNNINLNKEKEEGLEVGRKNEAVAVQSCLLDSNHNEICKEK
jgi:hypothetical protein